MDYEVDISALNDEFTRASTSNKPGEPKKKFNSQLDTYVKMPKGDGYVNIRLLGSLPGQKFPFAASRIHNLTPLNKRLPGTRQNNQYCARVLDPVEKRWMGDCFYCNYYSNLYKKADAARAKGDIDLADHYVALAKGIKAQDKYHYNAIVRNSKENCTGQTEADGVKIYSCGIQMHTFILEAVVGNKEMDKAPKGNVFSIKNGRDLKIVKRMKPGGQFPDYSGSEFSDPKPLHTDTNKINEWLSKMHDVFALRKVGTVDDMKKQIRIYEEIDKPTDNVFDESFLSNNDFVNNKTVVSVDVAPPVSKEVVNKVDHEIPVVEDSEDEMVDDAFLNSVRAAIRSN